MLTFVSGCDGVIQQIANLKDSSECNTPCSGDNTFTCGGQNRISIFTDGTPSPKIPTLAFRPEPTEDATFIPSWQYSGCYRWLFYLLLYQIQNRLASITVIALKIVPSILYSQVWLDLMRIPVVPHVKTHFLVVPI